MHEEISLSDTHSEERSRNTQYKSESKDLASTIEPGDQFKGSTLSGVPDSGRKFQHVPLYQRVLSALIIDDNVEEFDENGWGRCMSSQNAQLDSPDDACHIIDGENKIRDRMELEYETANGFQTQSNGAISQFISYNASDLSGRKSSDQASPYNGEFMHSENGYLHSEVQVLVGLSGHDSDGAQSHGNSSNDFDYEQLSLEDKLMLELQSIGLYPETVVCCSFFFFFIFSVWLFFVNALVFCSCISLKNVLFLTCAFLYDLSSETLQHSCFPFF